MVCRLRYRSSGKSLLRGEDPGSFGSQLSNTLQQFHTESPNRRIKSILKRAGPTPDISRILGKYFLQLQCLALSYGTASTPERFPLTRAAEPAPPASDTGNAAARLLQTGSIELMRDRISQYQTMKKLPNSIPLT